MHPTLYYNFKDKNARGGKGGLGASGFDQGQHRLGQLGGNPGGGPLQSGPGLVAASSGSPKARGEPGAGSAAGLLRGAKSPGGKHSQSAGHSYNDQILNFVREQKMKCLLVDRLSLDFSKPFNPSKKSQLALAAF